MIMSNSGNRLCVLTFRRVAAGANQREARTFYELRQRMDEFMYSKYRLLWTALLVLGFSAAGAQELPEPANNNARDAAQLPAEAAEGLAIAAEKTAGLPEEATIRLMDDDEHLVTHDVQLPELPEEGAAGQQGLDIAGEAIAGGADFGQEMADEARDGAQDAAEGRGRAEDLPEGVPGRPDDLPVDPPPRP